MTTPILFKEPISFKVAPSSRRKFTFHAGMVHEVPDYFATWLVAEGHATANTGDKASINKKDTQALTVFPPHDLIDGLGTDGAKVWLYSISSLSGDISQMAQEVEWQDATTAQQYIENGQAIILAWPEPSPLGISGRGA